VLLYEMLTGQQMFGGETVSDTLAAVLRADLDWAALPASTPAPIRRLLRRCLERDRKKRLPDIADARLEIDEALATAPMEPAVSPAPPTRSRALPWVVAAAFAAVALALALLHFRESPPENRLTKLLILPPEKTTFGDIAASPDGRFLAFTATDSSDKTQIWVRKLDSITPQPLAGTDGASNLFWSPDNRFIGFFAGGSLKKIDASGGPAQTLCPSATSSGGSGGATWSRDGVIVFSPSAFAPLSMVAAAGGEARALTTLDASRQESNHRWPFFLSDGRHFLYSVQSSRSENSGIFIQALDAKDRTRLLGDTSNAAYAGGYLLFTRSGTLMAQRFDTGKLQLAGEPLPIVERVGAGFLGHSEYSVSDTGLLVYNPTGAGTDSQLTWFDRSGERLMTLAEPGHQQLRLQLSPDEKQVAVDRMDSQAGAFDVWLIDQARGIPSRFTFDPSFDWYPVWSPDGARIAFASNRMGHYDLYVKISSSGAGKEELLLKTEQMKFPTDWSFDGRFLLYNQFDPRTHYDVWVLALSDKKPTPFLHTEFNERDASFSPDGKWIAYTSDESGKEEIYAQTFPASGNKLQISKGGGSRARWCRDGKELFYLAADRKIMAVKVTIGATIQAGAPQPLFDTRIAHSFARFAVAANGQRFLVPVPVSEASATPATVVINWTAGIKP
jgi:eukaryotic-like serine/threonine-protein kinase